MNKIAISIWIVVAGITALIETSAFAADMAVKMPPTPMTVAYGSTGLYVGGNAGYGFGSASNDLQLLQSLWIFNASEHERFDGVIGGGQAGYNWQAGTFVYGIETDIQGSGQKQTSSFNGAMSSPILGIPNSPFTATETDKIDWFGTLRGRLGITRDQWLFYAAGGLAYGHVSSSGIFQPTPVNGPNPPFMWNDSKTNAGWTIGAGIEQALFGSWSWRIEYLYVDLGKLTATVSGGAGACYGANGACNGPLPPGTMTVTSHVTDNVVRVGLNYQFH